jgi:hypothetical protein
MGWTTQTATTVIARHPLLLLVLLAASIDDLIDQAKLDSFLRRHIVISLQCRLEPRPSLICHLVFRRAMLDVNVGELRADPQDLFGVHGDITRLTLSASRRFCKSAFSLVSSFAPRAEGKRRRKDNSRWIMTVEFFNAYLCPFSPPASNRLPILAAMPRQNVCTGAEMYCMVSYIASPALTDPPGELMYSLMGFRESSASRKSSCAVSSVEVWSCT